jgi:hypothetical protein
MKTRKSILVLTVLVSVLMPPALTAAPKYKNPDY